MAEEKIAQQPKAGAGLSAWEAIQLAASLDLPLSHFGLADTPENRKTVDDLKTKYDDMRSRGIGIDIAS